MVTIEIKQLTAHEIYDFLVFNDNIFVPPLSTRVDVKSYSYKLHNHAVHFCATENGSLVGLIACYFNHPSKEFGFISSLSVINEHQHRGVASMLLSSVINHGIAEGFAEIRLQVNNANLSAIRLYGKFGFIEKSRNNNFIEMGYNLTTLCNNTLY